MVTKAAVYPSLACTCKFVKFLRQRVVTNCSKLGHRKIVFLKISKQNYSEAMDEVNY